MLPSAPAATARSAAGLSRAPLHARRRCSPRRARSTSGPPASALRRERSGRERGPSRPAARRT
eukprot:3331022-Pyramimonas_sp.AAC.1